MFPFVAELNSEMSLMFVSRLLFENEFLVLQHVALEVFVTTRGSRR